jgi:hypothetical protein
MNQIIAPCGGRAVIEGFRCKRSLRKNNPQWVVLKKNKEMKAVILEFSSSPLHGPLKGPKVLFK